MRKIVLSSRMRCLNQVAAITLITSAMAGCSSDFSRFDPGLYTNSIAARPQQQSAVNPYPGDVDPQTTASVGGSPVGLPPVPAGQVGTYARTQVAAPIPSYQTPSFSRLAIKKPAVQTYASKTYTPKTYAPQTYTKSVAPIVKTPAVVTYQAPAAPTYKQPVAVAQQTAKVDRIVTSSLKPAVSVAPKPVPVKSAKIVKSNQSRTSGWTSAGGTAIIVRDGETVYNISKRYGVPASELLRVNNISHASKVTAGSQIIIPTYVYSSKAPVSAPDSNPATRASRSSTGYLLQPDVNKVAVPTRKPSGYKPGLAPISLNKKPVRVTQNSYYTVQSGDSLGRIAINNNVTKNQIIAANSLSSSNIRIGQKLVIPGSNQLKPGLAPMKTDRVVTGSTNNASQGPKPYRAPTLASKDQKAPSRTGIDNFRWPVTGRVISKFGQTRRGNRNDGIDISVPEGTSVKAAENGIVIYSGTELQEFGRLLLVRHEDGWVSAYAHNKSLLVKDGQKIRRGQVIAKSGRSGKAQVPMLHFELRKDSNPVNPQKHLR